MGSFDESSNDGDNADENTKLANKSKADKNRAGNRKYRK